MRRRTFLRGLAVGAVFGPTALLVRQHTAEAAAARYHVAVVDQNVNEVRVFDRNAKTWNDDAIIWSFKGVDHWPGHGWADLSDAKIRKTQSRGLIALVAASGGGVGIADVKEKGGGRPTQTMT
jgi:hypothetical protein